MRNAFKTISLSMAVYTMLDDLMYEMRLPSFNTLISVMIPVMKQELKDIEEAKYKDMIAGTNPATE